MIHPEPDSLDPEYGIGCYHPIIVLLNTELSPYELF